MQTVIETNAFIADADDAGMDADMREEVVSMVATDPQRGDLLKGTGGFRKFRVAKPGKGKSGGWRVVSFFAGVAFPVFLITVFGKNQKVNLSQAERNALAKMARKLTEGLK